MEITDFVSKDFWSYLIGIFFSSSCQSGHLWLEVVFVDSRRRSSRLRFCCWSNHYRLNASKGGKGKASENLGHHPILVRFSSFQKHLGVLSTSHWTYLEYVKSSSIVIWCMVSDLKNISYCDDFASNVHCNSIIFIRLISGKIFHWQYQVTLQELFPTTSTFPSICYLYDLLSCSLLVSLFRS